MPLVRDTLAREKTQRRARRQALKTLGLALFAGGGAWLARDPLRDVWQDWQADHHTARGERRSLMLADASRIDLDTGTAIDVRFDGAQRLVRLLRGRILVSTASDPAATAGGAFRPFVVQTAQGRVRALGTRYSVRQYAQRSRVAVFEGAVEIHPDLDAQAPQLLRAGEQAWFTREAMEDVQRAAPGEAAWSAGMLAVQNMPLAMFIEELARYTPGRLQCAPDAGRLKVSGIYPLDDVERVLDMLQRTLPVDVDRLTRYWLTVRLRAA